MLLAACLDKLSSKLVPTVDVGAHPEAMAGVLRRHVGGLDKSAETHPIFEADAHPSTA